MDTGKSLPPRKGSILDGIALRWLQPRHTSKWLQAELGVSPRQAHRILYEGRIAGAVREKLNDLIRRALAENNHKVRVLDQLIEGNHAVALALRAGHSPSMGTGAALDAAEAERIDALNQLELALVGGKGTKP